MPEILSQTKLLTIDQGGLKCYRKEGVKSLFWPLVLFFIFSLWVSAKELTILHTNDIHGTYLAEEGVGGFKAISHYVSQAKSESDGPVFLLMLETL